MRKWALDLAKAGEALAAAALRSAGKPVPDQLRRRVHVKKALKAMAAAKKAQEQPE